MVLIDGLGYEELGQPGSQVSSMWLTGSAVVDDQISGANIYSTGTLQGENVYGDTTVSGLTVKGDTVNNAEGELQSVSIGSATAVYGAKIQAGSSALSAGSNLWLVFPVTFTASPIVQAQDMTNADVAMVTIAGSLSAGSAYIEGPTASAAISFIAVGI